MESVDCEYYNSKCGSDLHKNVRLAEGMRGVKSHRAKGVGCCLLPLFTCAVATSSA